MNQKAKLNIDKWPMFFVICTVFFIGFFSACSLNSLYSSNLEKPLSFSSNPRVHAPGDFIKESDITVYPDRIVINISNASLSAYAPTGSMVPLFDKGANGIRVKPHSENDVHVGDIVSYRSGNDLIVHRIIEKGVDEQGTYFIPKGDANPSPDKKIRLSDIEYIAVGILY